MNKLVAFHFVNGVLIVYLSFVISSDKCYDSVLALNFKDLKKFTAILGQIEKNEHI